jgi:hypothetical protein
MSELVQSINRATDKEIVSALQEVTKALNTQISQGIISAQRSNAQTKSSTDITNKMLSQMISVYKGSVPKDGVSGPPKESLLLQNLLELDKRREDKADRRAAEKAAKDEAAAEEQRIADEKEASLDRFSRENIRKTMATLDTSNRDMGMGFAGFRDSFKLENLKKAKETKAFQVKERKTMKLRENNKLKFEIREKRAEAKKERFDKGNPLQRMVKFQKEAKLARITAKNERKTQRAADRKERNTKLYNKMASILKGVLVFGVVVVTLGLILKGIGGLMNLFKSFSSKFPDYATDLEKTGKITDEMKLDSKRDLAGPEFTDEERKIGKKNETTGFGNAMRSTAEFIRDNNARIVRARAKIDRFKGNVGGMVGLKGYQSMKNYQADKLDEYADENLNAASYNSIANARSKDNTVRQIAVSRQREELVAAGATKQELRTFDMISGQRSMKDRQDRKRLEIRASGKTVGMFSANKEDRERYNSMSQEEAQEQLDKLTLTDSGKAGMFKGTRDQETFFQNIMGKYEKEGKSLTNQQGEIIDDITANNPNFMKSNSQMTSVLVAQFGKGGDVEKRSVERNALLKRIADSQAMQTGVTTIIDASTKDMSTTTTGGGSSSEITVTGSEVQAEDTTYKISIGD